MKTYTKQEVMTLLRIHLVQSTLGDLTDREHQIIGEVDLALKEHPKGNNTLRARVKHSYPKPVAA